MAATFHLFVTPIEVGGLWAPEEGLGGEWKLGGRVGIVVYCSKKVLTSRISGPDKYQQVVLGVRKGVYGPMVNYCESF